MAQVMTFPKKFERNFFRDMDYGFMSIWLLTFIILNAVAFYAQSLPVRDLKADEVKKYMEAIYRVKIQKAPVVAEVSDKGGAEVAAEVPEEAAAEEEAPKELSAEDKKAAREQAKAARSARAEARRKAIAERLKVLAGPTVRGRTGRRSGASVRAAVGLSDAGGGGGADLKGALAIIGDAETASKVKKLRGGGAISEDVGNLDIADLKGFLADPGNLKAMLNEAPIKLSRKAITARGKGSKKRQRSQKAISQVVLANRNQIQYCYWTYKRRDSSLKGQVVVEFTINPTGEVIRVRFRKSNWGRNPLKRDMERCIKNIIGQWRFDPIDEADGNVTAGATFIFE